MKNEKIQTIIDAIEKAATIAIVTHVGPDGDAAGSSLALSLILRKLGKNANAYLRKDDIGAPRVMNAFKEIKELEEAPPNPDLLICLDCATIARINAPIYKDRLNELTVATIDHHQSNEGYGNYRYIVPDASSTGELVWQIAKQAGWEIDTDTAEALWVAVVTDTNRFSYSSTKPETLEFGADLLRKGIRQDFLNDELFYRSRIDVLRLRAIAYSSLELWYEGKVAIIHLDAEDYIKTNCCKADTEDFSDIPRSVRGTKLAIFFYRSRQDEDVIHLSIRSTLPVKASNLAVKFGGGGHELAAGATIKGSMQEVIQKVKSAVAEVLPAAM